MSLSVAGREHIIDLNAQLSIGRFKNIPYENVQLAGHPLTEVIVPGSKPVLEASAYAGYWPGNFPDGNEFAMVVSDDTLEYLDSEKSVILCKQIQQLHLNRQSLNRHEQRVQAQPQVQRMRERLGRRLVPKIMETCVEAGSPLTYLTIGKWVATPSSYGKLYGAVMHFPAGMYPKVALANLRANAKPPME